MTNSGKTRDSEHKKIDNTRLMSTMGYDMDGGYNKEEIFLLTKINK